MKTIGELKDKLKKFTDTEEETFIKEDELCCMLDMAMRKAQKIIEGLCADYFVSCEVIPVPAGTASISLPEDISGSQIRSVQWESEKECCPLKRLPAEYCSKSKTCPKPEGYQFFNKKGEGPQLYLVPAGSVGSVKIIYNRKLETLEGQADTAELEMPEFCDFIYYATKAMIYEKTENPLINLAIAQMNEEQDFMKENFEKQFKDEQSCNLEVDECWREYVDEYC